MRLHQELLEQLAYAEECGKLITPPCWTTGDFCTGKLVVPLATDSDAKPAALLLQARAAGLAVYPWTFRNEVRLSAADLSQRGFGSGLGLKVSEYGRDGLWHVQERMLPVGVQGSLYSTV